MSESEEKKEEVERWALISVSDKKGLLLFAERLVAMGWKILSTGGTAEALRGFQVPCEDVSSYTDFPEMMDGRVKTLHPKIHGSLLARRDKEEHLAAMEEFGMRKFDLVICNLYPFAETIRNPKKTLEDVIENIDIGGPSMIRSAAKNCDSVTVLTDYNDYDGILKDLRDNGETSIETRRRLAAKAFAHCAAYDTMISQYLRKAWDTGEKYDWGISGKLRLDLRYGENPHQGAAFYRLEGAPEGSLGRMDTLGGKELSYNNILDMDAAIELMREFHPSEMAACTIIKHGNPCGTGTAETMPEAFQRAHEGDPLSAFGSIVAINRPLDEETAKLMAAPGLFIECLVAPFIADPCADILRGAKFGKNLRMVEVGEMKPNVKYQRVRSVCGGFLVQDNNPPENPEEPIELQCVTKRQPSEEELADLRFAWPVCKHVRSNAIVLAKSQRTVGIGAGQMSRVDSVKIAVEKSDGRSQGAVLASDAFFPFADGPEAAAAAGVTAIIQPGGSRRDAEVIEAADKHGLAMVFTGQRHFRH